MYPGTQAHGTVRRARRWHVPVFAGAVIPFLVGLSVILPATPAGAVSCTGQVRYAASTNTIYLTSGELNLPDIVAICPSAPLVQVTTGVWELRANLVLQTGAILHVKGATAGGTV